MITVRDAEVSLTEQTIREILRAIELVKAGTEFTNEAMPDKLAEGEGIIEEKKRGIIRIKSPYSKISFKVRIETKPQTQESLGYKLI